MADPADARRYLAGAFDHVRGRTGRFAWKTLPDGPLGDRLALALVPVHGARWARALADNLVRQRYGPDGAGRIEELLVELPRRRRRDLEEAEDQEDFDATFPRF